MHTYVHTHIQSRMLYGVRHSNVLSIVTFIITITQAIVSMHVYTGKRSNSTSNVLAINSTSIESLTAFSCNTHSH